MLIKVLQPAQVVEVVARHQAIELWVSDDRGRRIRVGVCTPLCFDRFVGLEVWQAFDHLQPRPLLNFCLVGPTSARGAVKTCFWAMHFGNRYTDMVIPTHFLHM